MRRFSVLSLASLYVLSSNVTGSSVPIVFVAKRLNQGRPLESRTIPYGRFVFRRLPGWIGGFTMRNLPVATSRKPIAFDACAVNQMLPFLSNTIVCGSFTVLSGTLNRVISPDFGSIRPSDPFWLPVYQTLPFESTRQLCGCVPGSSSYFRNCPVFG